MLRKVALYLLPFLALASMRGYAQGFLPVGASSTTVVSTTPVHPLLIGETAPESLAVMGDNGKKRTLLSYKAPTELLAVTFFSTTCEYNKTLWANFRRLHKNYLDWRVSFLAVAASEQEAAALAELLKREDLPWPVVRDEASATAHLLRISATPEVVVLDEYGVLKYRGPVADAPKALDTIVGHIETVKIPEPAMTESCPR